MTLTSTPTHSTDRVGDEAQLVFEEARKRRRRRWFTAGIILIVLALIATGIASTISTTAVKRVRPKLPLPPQVVGLPTGAFVSLRHAGPLAVNATGSLFIVDEVRHDVLVRLNNGAFRVVAGDGVSGFTGDGGPATKAELSDVTDCTFGPNGISTLPTTGGSE